MSEQKMLGFEYEAGVRRRVMKTAAAKKLAGEWRWHPTKTRGRPPRDRTAANSKIST